MWFAAVQSGSKPAANSATEAKTEKPSQLTESQSDAASAAVKPDTAAAVREPAASATESTASGNDESEGKTTAVEDLANEEKMDTGTNEQKTEEVSEEVSLVLCPNDSFVSTLE